MAEQAYYGAQSHPDGFRGWLYRYDETGCREITIWKSVKVYPTIEKAILAAADYAEANGIGCIMD